MTVNEMLTWSQRIILRGENVPHDLDMIAEAITNQLGVGQPCTISEPEPDVAGRPLMAWMGMLLDADELRGIAVMLLRKADDLEKA